jgi:tape measure domain-containing protein
VAEERIDIVITERGSRVVKRNLEDIGEGARKSADGVDFLKRALSALGGAVAARELVRLLDTYTNLNNRLRATGLEAQNLTAVYQELRAVANDTRSSFEGSVELYSRLAISSKELGVSQQDLIEFTKSLNQAIILSGASATEAQAGLIQLSQGMASGTLRGDELRSVLEQLPAVADVIAKELGVTRGELRKMGEDGKITAGIILDAFKSARDELEQRFGRTVPTISQSFQVLKDNVIDMVGRFDQATGASEAISRALLFVSENLDTIAKVAVSAAAGIALVGGTASAINLARNAVLALNAAIAATPVGFLLVGLTSAVTALTLFRDQVNLGVGDVTTLGDMMRALGETVGAVFGAIWQWAKDTFGPLIQLIQDWVGEVEVSIIGILRLVAKGVDTYIGAWRGAIDAVVALFKGLPAALGDLTTRALNVVLDKIGSFVNAAGELLSTVTEFAGLGKIAAVDLRLTNENEGAARKLGQDIGAAFSEGFSNTNYAQDFLERTVTRAQQIGKDRVAAEGGPAADLNQRGTRSVVPDAEAAKKAAEALKKLQDSLASLIGSYDRVWAAQQEYTEGVKLLEQAEAAGLITAERKAQVITLMQEQLRDAMDPLGALNRELERESELLKMTADQREVENQLRSIQQDLLRQGIILNEQELTQLRERLTLLQAEAAVQDQRNRALQAILGPQQEFMAQLEAINGLIAEGLITQEQATAYLVEQQNALFEGTLEQQQAWVTSYEQTLAQIDALRQADLISEQTAAQMKAKANADLYAKQLGNAISFFGNLASLSRSENRTLAAIGKAAAVTQATIDGVVAVQKALASAPPPANYALAAAVGVATAANVAQIMSTNLGFQTGGSFVVGGTGGPDSQMVAFRATPGEKVSVARPEQVRKGNPYEGAGQMPAPQLNARIINVLDPAMVGDFLSTPDGEHVLVNVMRRNSDSLRAIVSEG